VEFMRIIIELEAYTDELENNTAAGYDALFP
jgi:hypothetical protein